MDIHIHHIRHIQDHHIQDHDIPNQHIPDQDHIHILHTEDQHQPWLQAQHQQISCHNIQVLSIRKIQDHILDQHIQDLYILDQHIPDQDHIHILHKEDQHQPWLQDQPLVQHQQISCHNIQVLSIHKIQDHILDQHSQDLHILDHHSQVQVHNHILHTEVQHQPWHQ